MESFTITTLLTKKDYSAYLFKEVYKKPYTVLITILGFVLVITAALEIFNVIDIYDDHPFFQLVLGIFLLISPVVNVLIAKRTYYSNPSLSHDISYTFGQDDIKVKCLTFDSTLKWKHIIKMK